ncbi:tetratricopeptide repeat protein [Qipengyuania marisflavi]|uniref:Tetratricopeptide repeat protein n=1 Tax=Qipengyuania marisflavi TaxID=2486356 RepID=A0A5S3P716_9SPHN|nr:tetratricopeptide repeat protein [Qipengyuania marisflavi]TMM48812.1 tetratricopeptide repeat protein [Qipengyuania marisflavi]
MSIVRRLTGAAALAALCAGPSTGWAQSGEVVQPLPPAGSDALETALGRLARDPRNVGALVDAGEAALELGDIDAATGFFGRAQDLSPGDPRVKLGMARAFVRARRPIEALRLFAEAERGGIPVARMAADRGLAFDLVGDSASAQAMYRTALRQGSDDELIRRLAISQAIAGNRQGFEESLLPLLKQGNLSAFRTRAFGLAILGEEKEALSIAGSRMTPALAQQMAPYLSYMPRLTQAQQAAAANLGLFPRAANIGTDDAAIAQYTRSGGRSADAGLVPSGTPLGAQANNTPKTDPRSRERRRRPDRTGSRSARDSGGTAYPGRPRVDPQAGRSTRRQAAAKPVVTPKPAPPPPPSPSPAPSPTPVQVAGPTPIPAPSIASTVAPGPAPTKPPVVIINVPTPAEAASPTPVVVATVSDPAPPLPAPQPADVADAFASFDLADTARAEPAPGAVDITAIAIPREVEEAKPPPPPPPPPKAQHPSRHWVQVATGKDRAALKYDWRRIARRAAGRLDKNGPFVTPWGVSSRLLAGPFPTATAAREMVKELNALNLDSFTFTSKAGEEIEPL